MKKYIFYTTDGFTYDNNHDEANNMQILGDGVGKNIDEALEHFKYNQPYIHAQAFKNIMAIQTVGDTILNIKL